MKPKIYISRLIPESGLNLLTEECDITLWVEEGPPPRERMLQDLKDKVGYLSMLTDKVDTELFDRAPGLKVVSNYAVGFDNINVAEATHRGIPVGNTPGVLTNTTADLAFSLLMAAARRIPEGVAHVQEGKWKTWSPLFLLGQDISSATLGIIGFGRIGQAMAQRASGFGMRVLAYDPIIDSEAAKRLNVESVSIELLLKEADFISLHCLLTPHTRHLISEKEFSHMKPTAILINTARGPIIDSAALYQALKRKVIGGAALDVTDPEPIAMDDPLLTLPNCLIVPHMGSASVATRGKMAEMAAANLLAGLRGEPLPNCVNPEVYNK